jgi:CHAT domain-containing protein
MDRGSGARRAWEYVDFELEVREGGPRNYIVTVRSPRGDMVRGEMHFPFDKLELANKLLALENALLRSGQSRRRIRSPEENTVQDFGQGLFQALLAGEVRTCYEMSRDQARREDKGLRLKLRIEPPEVARLPWEFIYDSSRREYLCLSSKTPLVRHLEVHEPVEQLSVTPPLRILGMVASPRDLDPLDIEHEKQLVEEAVKNLQEQERIELTWLEGQTWRDLMRTMRQGPWHAFHFIGHGSYDPDRDEGLIALADSADRARLLRATELARLLDDHFPLRLVLLNSCEGARGGERDVFSSTAATLVSRGIPAVLAMQYEITDEAAIEFSRAFYEAVADGLPLDAAVGEARTSLSIEIGDTLEWGTPVLYMRSPDGCIFNIEVPLDSPQREPEDREDEERQNRLDELYAQACRSYQAQEWRAVVGVFDQIRAVDPEYSDPEGLLVSAREALATLEPERRAAAVYDQGLRHMEAEEWPKALQCFKEVQRLASGYRQIETLLARVRQALAGERRPITDQDRGQGSIGRSYTRPDSLPPDKPGPRQARPQDLPN